MITLFFFQASCSTAFVAAPTWKIARRRSRSARATPLSWEAEVTIPKNAASGEYAVSPKLAATGGAGGVDLIGHAPLTVDECIGRLCRIGGRGRSLDDGATCYDVHTEAPTDSCSTCQPYTNLRAWTPRAMYGSKPWTHSPTCSAV